MAHIGIGLVNAWTDRDRFNLVTLDDELESQISAQVIQRASRAFDTSLWSSEDTTPPLIKSIIAMQYAGRSYQSKTVDNISELDNYGSKLIRDANTVLDAVVSGEIPLKDGDGELIPIVSSGAISGEPIEGDPYFVMDAEF